MRWAADENFNNDIIRGLLRRKPDVDIVRVQDECSLENEWQGQVRYLPLR